MTIMKQDELVFNMYDFVWLIWTTALLAEALERTSYIPAEG